MTFASASNKTWNLHNKKTVFLFGGMFCVFCVLAYAVYPSLLGEIIAAVFGAGSLPEFWIKHPAALSAFQTAVRFLFGVCVIGTLDGLVLLYTYKLLESLVVRSSSSGTVLWVSARAWWRLLGFQIVLGLLACLVFVWQDGFSVYVIVPTLVSSSFMNNLWMWIWLVTTVCFALGFATEESFSRGAVLGWGLFRRYLPLWLLMLAAVLLMLWTPVLFLAGFGLRNGGLVSSLLTLWGSFSYFVLLNGALIYLFNRSDLFVSVSEQE